mmetsp:Transcript_8905/g.20792  ORF Transcript_8905/g.20792 Transcript_8905/m.20792 type:complete len:208 (-) Transcript_8905:1137-1760(-)
MARTASWVLSTFGRRVFMFGAGDRGLAYAEPKVGDSDFRLAMLSPPTPPPATPSGRERVREERFNATIEPEGWSEYCASSSPRMRWHTCGLVGWLANTSLSTEKPPDFSKAARALGSTSAGGASWPTMPGVGALAPSPPLLPAAPPPPPLPPLPAPPPPAPPPSSATALLAWSSRTAAAAAVFSASTPDWTRNVMAWARNRMFSAGI